MKEENSPRRLQQPFQGDSREVLLMAKQQSFLNQVNDFENLTGNTFNQVNTTSITTLSGNELKENIKEMMVTVQQKLLGESQTFAVVWFFSIIKRYNNKCFRYTALRVVELNPVNT